MDDTKKLIEKYKRELMEFSRANPQRSSKESGQWERQTERETMQQQEGQLEWEPAHRPEREPMRQQERQPERETERQPEREPMRQQERQPERQPEREPMQPEQEKKQPKIIGYVSEESGEYPSVFDKFITDAMENDEIETVSSAEPIEPEPRPEDVPEAHTTPRAPEINSENTMEELSQGTGESISNFTVPTFSSLEEFEARNRGGGMLEFRVFAARQAVPIGNADVRVTTRIDGKDYEMFSAKTNNSGEVAAVVLPAPSRELSQQSGNRIQPFSLYDATVDKKGFTKVILRDIPIFDGVRSIQKVAMLPLSDQSDGAADEITEVQNAE